MEIFIKEKLIEILDNRNMSLVDLAHKSHLPFESIKNLYYGKTKNPRLETIIAIAEALDISVDLLIGRKNYAIDEINFLKKYRNCSYHGKCFVQAILDCEERYTKFENLQPHEHIITCIEPTGYIEKGVLWDSCTISTTTTYHANASFAFIVPTHIYTPTYNKNDVLFIEYRFPDEGENALFYKENKLYLRKFKFDEKNKIYTLKSLSLKMEDLIEKNLNDYTVLGTVICPNRCTSQTPINPQNLKTNSLPLKIQDLMQKIKDSNKKIK